MERINLTEDIYPISEFRYNVSEMISKTKKTQRPILITQNGKGTAVLLDVHQYEKLLDKSELAMEISIAEQQIKEGKTLPHKKAYEKVMNSLK